MMDFFRSLAGMIQIELTSADIAAALAAVSAEGIRMDRASIKGELTAEFWINRQDYRRVAALAEKRGERLKILQKKGLYWSVMQLLRRPVLMSGICLLLALVLFVPSRIFFVQVEGNETVPARKILEAAQDSGIRFGSSRRAVRSEQVKNELLSALPELQWAGINTFGCVAVISVRERSIPEKTESMEGICSIVAARDGVILSCTAQRGNLLCHVGQAVQSGEVLISAYTDCGLTVTATRAEGEILAQTRREMTAVTLAKCQIRGHETSRTTRYSLILGKKRINFYKGSGIWDATCGKMYKEYHLTLPGGFRLPVTLVKEEEISYEISDAVGDQPEAEKQLTAFAEDYLRGIMVAGSVTNSDCLIFTENGVYCLSGEFSCTEMIDSVRWEEKIGE